MKTFEELVASRKSWISEVLRPWCLRASRTQLRKADVEWLDIAGKVPTEKTLWVWAWSRFPSLVHESLGIEETLEVLVELRDGRKFRGFPDARQSLQGDLFVWGQYENSECGSSELGPFSIDDIVSVRSKSNEPHADNETDN